MLLAGFLLRLWLASGTFLNPDEALHFRIANQISLAAVYRASLTESHPPLLYWILHFLRGVAASELWLRLPSVIAGMFFCWFFFRWLTLVTGRVSGFVGLMLVAFLPPVVRLSADVRQYELMLAFAAAALYCLERALAKGSVWLMATSSVCALLAMSSHYSAFFFVAALGVYALMKIFWRGREPAVPRKVVAIWIVGQLFAVALLVFYYKTHLALLGQGESRTVLQGWMSEFYLRRSYFEAGKDNPLLFAIGHSFGVFQFVFGQLAVGDVAGLMFVAGTVLLWLVKGETRTFSRQLAVFLILLFALGCAASLAHKYPYGGTRHIAYLIIPAVAGVSFAIARMASERWTRGLALGLLVVVICAGFGKQRQPYMTRADQSRANMREAMAFVRDNVAPGSLIFTDFESSMFLGHYLCEQKPISVEAASLQFESFYCSRYHVVSTNRRTATNFTPEVFLKLGDNVTAIYGLKPGESLWVFQAGWGADLPERLRAESPKFRDLAFRAFGNNIKIFEAPGRFATAGPQAYSGRGLAR